MKIGDNGLIERECCIGPYGCLREPAWQYSNDACMHSLSFQCSTVALIVLFQDIYCNPPLCSRNAAALQQAYKSIWVCRARWAMLGKGATHGSDATSEQHARRRPRRQRRRQLSPQETVGRQSLPLARSARSLALPLWTSSSRWPGRGRPCRRRPSRPRSTLSTLLSASALQALKTLQWKSILNNAQCWDIGNNCVPLAMRCKSVNNGPSMGVARSTHENFHAFVSIRVAVSLADTQNSAAGKYIE